MFKGNIKNTKYTAEALTLKKFYIIVIYGIRQIRTQEILGLTIFKIWVPLQLLFQRCCNFILGGFKQLGRNADVQTNTYKQINLHKHIESQRKARQAENDFGPIVGRAPYFGGDIDDYIQESKRSSGDIPHGK